MTQIDDPHAQREAQKYDNPIPSREFIMDHLRDRSGPATLKQVSFELALFEAEDVEALRRRLRAMERDGQLIMVDDERMPIHDGEKIMQKMVRFRTLGCYPLTGAIESEANTLEGIIQEMLLTRTSERQGRVIDQDADASMEQKKQEGYF